MDKWNWRRRLYDHDEQDQRIDMEIQMVAARLELLQASMAKLRKEKQGANRAATKIKSSTVPGARNNEGTIFQRSLAYEKRHTQNVSHRQRLSSNIEDLTLEIESKLGVYAGVKSRSAGILQKVDDLKCKNECVDFVVKERREVNAAVISTFHSLFDEIGGAVFDALGNDFDEVFKWTDRLDLEEAELKAIAFEGAQLDEQIDSLRSQNAALHAELDENAVESASAAEMLDQRVLDANRLEEERAALELSADELMKSLQAIRDDNAKMTEMEATIDQEITETSVQLEQAQNELILAAETLQVKEKELAAMPDPRIDDLAVFADSVMENNDEEE